MLRAVTFDLWQTLLLDSAENLGRARQARVRGIVDLLAGSGHAVSGEAVHRAYDRAGERLEGLWRTQADVGPRGQLRWMLESLGMDKEIPERGPMMDALEAAYTEPILAYMPHANPGAGELLAALRGRGLSLGLICNTGRTPGRMLRPVLERLGLFPYLSVLTFSDEVGLRKPHPELFRRTLQALGATPAEAVHIGDDVSTDIAGARGFGMRGVHLCHAQSASPAPDAAESVGSLAEFGELLFGGGAEES
jgi:putative hydrolase of the HAD superfamily